MKKRVAPAVLNGSITIQPSKSVMHRAAICAALAKGKSNLYHFLPSKDLQATLGCIDSLWIGESQIKDDKCEIKGNGQAGLYGCIMDCNESGSTLRFFIPLALSLARKASFTGAKRLFERPLGPIRDLLVEKGIRWEQTENGISVEGRLLSGEYSIPGNVSSQYISGLLFALPLLEGDSKILLTTPLESAGYVELTRQVQENFGVQSKWEDERTLEVPGRQKYIPNDMVIEGDYSHAAFFAVAGALGGDITILGLNKDSKQGDREIFPILQRMGAKVEWNSIGVRVCGGNLCGTEIDAANIPDLVPALAAAACGAQGETRIYRAERLRLKESDRLKAIREEFCKLGADIQETDDGLIICGGRTLTGAEVSAHNDHRIAMALGISAAITQGRIEIDQAESVAKSAPDFWETYCALGGKAI